MIQQIDLSPFEWMVVGRLEAAGIPPAQAYRLAVQHRQAIDDALKRALDKEVERILD